MAAISNTDLFNSLVLVFLFNSGLIFMLIAFFCEWYKSVVFHAVAGIEFFVLAVLIPATATQFYPAGWLFLILGLANVVFGSIIGVSGLYQVWKVEEWEKEEDIYG